MGAVVEISNIKLTPLHGNSHIVQLLDNVHQVPNNRPMLGKYREAQTYHWQGGARW